MTLKLLIGLFIACTLFHTLLSTVGVAQASEAKRHGYPQPFFASVFAIFFGAGAMVFATYAAESLGISGWEEVGVWFAVFFVLMLSHAVLGLRVILPLFERNISEHR